MRHRFTLMFMFVLLMVTSVGVSTVDAQTNCGRRCPTSGIDVLFEPNKAPHELTGSNVGKLNEVYQRAKVATATPLMETSNGWVYRYTLEPGADVNRAITLFRSLNFVRSVQIAP